MASSSGEFRDLRDQPPSTYLFKIPQFSLLANSQHETHQSKDFEAGGHVWKLILYPNGNKEDGGEGYISLYLQIQDTASLHENWEVDVDMKLFAYKQDESKFLVVQDHDVKRFNEAKTEWGFAQFLPLDEFLDPENGYLVEDSCQFGAEIFAIQPPADSEVSTVMEDPETGNITWKSENLPVLDIRMLKRGTTVPSKPSSGVVRETRNIEPAHCLFPIDSFSKLRKEAKEPYESDAFEACGFKWKLALYPNGRGEGRKDKQISLYLRIVETEDFPHHWEVLAFFRFFIHDANNDNYLMVQESLGKLRRFYEIKKEWGIADLISMEKFTDPENGYLVDDQCCFGAEVFVVKQEKTRPTNPLGQTESSGTYLWKFENFSRLQTVGKPCFSKPFPLGGTQWKLVVYPNGAPNVINRCLSLYLDLHEPHTLSPNKVWQAKFTISVLNPVKFNHWVKEVEHNFTYKDYRRGFDDYMGLDLITEAQGFKHDDRVLVQVTFNPLILHDTIIKRSA